MKQEDKQQLLVKELCARQPWGVKVQYNNKVYSIDYVSAEYKEVKLDILDNYTVEISDVKPYLRPMSSMTEEEISDLQKINSQFNFNKFDNFAYVGAADDGFCSVEEMCNILNYLNSKHLDYRGMIPMDLAIEVTKENNPYEE